MGRKEFSMTTDKRGEDYVSNEEYNNRPIQKPSGRVWFLNGDLVRVYHRNRGQGIITLYNINEDKLQTILWDEWIRRRLRAYSMRQTAQLINRNKKYIPQLVRNEVIKPPRGSSIGGVRGFQIRSYYSEDDIREIRDILASRQWGKPRKDGLVTNNHTPTTQELRRRMGDGILAYTRTQDGNYIPVWDETV
jgi:hypothetical protein